MTNIERISLMIIHRLSMGETNFALETQYGYIKIYNAISFDITNIEDHYLIAKVDDQDNKIPGYVIIFRNLYGSVIMKKSVFHAIFKIAVLETIDALPSDDICNAYTYLAMETLPTFNDWKNIWTQEFMSALNPRTNQIKMLTYLVSQHINNWKLFCEADIRAMYNECPRYKVPDGVDSKYYEILIFITTYLGCKTNQFYNISKWINDLVFEYQHDKLKK